MKRNMKEIKLANDVKIDFTQFKAYNDSFPSLYHPAFILQNSLREKVLSLLFISISYEKSSNYTYY